MKMRASSTSLGLSRPAKRRPKRFLRKLVNYLKSDSYMFAPIISTSSKRKHRSSRWEGFHLNRSGFEIGGVEKEEEEKKKRLMEVIVEYLRSDSYFYAPLIDGDCYNTARHEKIADHTSKGAPCLKKRVTMSVAKTVLSRETIHQPAEDLRDSLAKGQTEQAFDTNHESVNGSDQRSKQDQILKQTVYPNCWKSLSSDGDFPRNDSLTDRVGNRRKIPVE